jgi:hypothetical protein
VAKAKPITRWNTFTRTPAEKMPAYVDRRFMPKGLVAFYHNGKYVVQEFHHETTWGEVVNLMIRYYDNTEPKRPPWYDMQRIKNELFGPERVAVEVFPKESRLVDQANMWHLWVLPEGFELPFSL